MPNKTLVKIEKEITKIDSVIEKLTAQKNNVLADIKSKTDYKKKLEQTSNTLQSLESNETSSMLNNINKEICKLSKGVDKLNEQKEILQSSIKTKDDYKKKLERIQTNLNELVEKENELEKEFINLKDGFDSSEKNHKEEKPKQNVEEQTEQESISEPELQYDNQQQEYQFENEGY